MSDLPCRSPFLCCAQLVALVALVASALSAPVRLHAQALVPRVQGDSSEIAIATAQQRTQVERIIRVFLDNDLFAWRDSVVPTDYEYTHGVGAVWHWADAPARVRGWLRDLPGCASPTERERRCLMATLGVRQAIYTPASNERFVVPGQRPHVGYLGGVAGLTHVTRHRTRAVHLELGTTGSLSLAEPTQKLIHEFTGSAPELGWKNQLSARPTLSLRLDETWQVAGQRAGVHARARWLWGAELGTLRTGGLVGAEVQLAPDFREFWTPHEGGQPLPLGPYLVAGAWQEFVARDLFVDGHPRDGTSTAVRIPGVQQTIVGFGWRFAGGTSEYRHVWRSREYDAQLRPHRFGRFVFTWYASR